MAAHELLEYVRNEKLLTEEEITRLKSLPESGQIDQGLLIPMAALVSQRDDQLRFSCAVNHSRVKPGDKMELCFNGRRETCVVIENYQDEISVRVDSVAEYLDVPYDLRVLHYQLLDPVIHALEALCDGAPGKGFWDTLFGEQAVRKKGLGAINPLLAERLLSGHGLNESQLVAAKRILSKPSMMAVQGPPGTGKTRLMAVATKLLVGQKQRIAVLAPTHQAVNNALAEIIAAAPDLSVFKLGESLKAEGLPKAIQTCSFHAFGKECREKKIKPQVIGMTFYAAITQLGLKPSAFAPNVVMIDEAGQLPLSYGALAGIFGAGSVICFGDDAQLPPIFLPELVDHPCSRSLFSQIRAFNPDSIATLDVSYRMNEEICEMVSSRYYRRDDGSNFLQSANNRDGNFSARYSENCPAWVAGILNNPQSVFTLTGYSDDGCCQLNVAEARAVAEMAVVYLESGAPPSSVVITAPFRKQVAAIKTNIKSLWNGELPLVDTVERVQGLSAEFVIISMTSSDPMFINERKDFLFSPNRMNVALSRAKRKVVVFACEHIMSQLF